MIKRLTSRAHLIGLMISLHDAILGLMAAGQFANAKELGGELSSFAEQLRRKLFLPEKDKS